MSANNLKREASPLTRLIALMAKHTDVPQARMGFLPDWQDDPFWDVPAAGGQT